MRPSHLVGLLMAVRPGGHGQPIRIGTGGITETLIRTLGAVWTHPQRPRRWSAEIERQVRFHFEACGHEAKTPAGAAEAWWTGPIVGGYRLIAEDRVAEVVKWLRTAVPSASLTAVELVPAPAPAPASASSELGVEEPLLRAAYTDVVEHVDRRLVRAAAAVAPVVDAWWGVRLLGTDGSRAHPLGASAAALVADLIACLALEPATWTPWTRDAPPRRSNAVTPSLDSGRIWLERYRAAVTTYRKELLDISRRLDSAEYSLPTRGRHTPQEQYLESAFRSRPRGSRATNLLSAFNSFDELRDRFQRNKSQYESALDQLRSDMLGATGTVRPPAERARAVSIARNRVFAGGRLGRFLSSMPAEHFLALLRKPPGRTLSWWPRSYQTGFHAVADDPWAYLPFACLLGYAPDAAIIRKMNESGRPMQIRMEKHPDNPNFLRRPIIRARRSATALQLGSGAARRS